jgi:hypothetical protein
MELSLTMEEQELLYEILERRLRELQREISHTDSREFKAVLWANEKSIESLLGRMRMSVSARAS